MKMTNKHSDALTAIRTDLTKVIFFLESPSVEVCTNQLPNALSYYDKDGTGLTPINKIVGSDLCYLRNALQKLDTILSKEGKQIDTA